MCVHDEQMPHIQMVCTFVFQQVINLSGKAKGDGIHWPLKDGCSEYDLTVRLTTLYNFTVEAKYSTKYLKFDSVEYCWILRMKTSFL